MSGLEVNKIIASVIVAILVVVIIGYAADKVKYNLVSLKLLIMRGYKPL